MMEFLSATDMDEKQEGMDAFMKNLMGAIQSEQAPLLTEVICSGMALAKENEWDAKTTTSFIKDVVDIFVNAQSVFAHKLAS